MTQSRSKKTVFYEHNKTSVLLFELHSVVSLILDALKRKSSLNREPHVLKITRSIMPQNTVNRINLEVEK